MRELTEAERQVLIKVNIDNIDYDNIEGFIEAGFTAGLEYQDAQVAELSKQLKACIAFLVEIGIDPEKVRVDGIDMDYFTRTEAPQ